MKDKYVSIRMEGVDKEFLKNHSKKNCRTLADTCRLAMKEWIFKEKRKAAKTE